jgi:general secretion pathway protein D
MITPAVDQRRRQDYISGVNRWLGPLLFLSIVGASVAQVPNNPPFQTRNAQLPGGPAGPVVTPTGANPTNQDEVRLQFPNTDIQIILKLYEELTGKHIVYDNSVLGSVSIDISKPVSRDEAIRIIETSLYLNSYTLIPTEGNIIKVVGAGKNPRNFGINIYSDITQLPDDVSVASVVFQLQFADSKDVKAIVDSYVSNSIYTSTVPLPGALIVTESTVMLRNIAKIIEAADVPPAEVVSRFYVLKRANAKDVLDKLTKLFEKTSQNGQGPGSGPITTPLTRLPNGQPAPPGSMQVPAAVSGLTEDSIIEGKIKVDYDERTNRIHVVTRPINLPFIEDLIKEYDSDIVFGSPVKRPLKYINADDVLDVIVKAITEPGEKTEDQTSGGETSSNRTNNQSQNSNSGGNTTGMNGSGGGSTGGLDVSSELDVPEPDTTPKAVTVGNTKIIADPRENTIIVLGGDEIRQKVFTLLDQLDVRAPQVMLNTVIGEFTLNNDSNYGIDYLLHYPSGPLANLLSSGSSAGTLGSTGFLNGHSGAAFSNFTGTPLGSTLGSALGAGNGFTAAIGAANSLDIIVNALESTGRFHITNTPMIYTENNKKAIIVSGQQIPVPTSTLSNVNTSGEIGNSTAALSSNINYMTVALQLEVVPLINSDREVNLDILQKLDSPSGSTTNIGGSNVPTISTRYIQTNVSVPNRATVVLGGLITKTVGGSTSALPWLGRIPVLGALFGNKIKQNDRSELIILIRPVVTTDPNEMQDESHVTRDHLLMEPDIDSTITPRDDVAKAAKGVNFRYQDDKQTQPVQQ